MRTRREIDHAILELAAATLSVVHERDLRAHGIDDDAVRRRVQHGWMSREVGRSFIVGPQRHVPTFEMRCMAGVLAAGAEGLLDGVTAASLLELWNRTCRIVHVSAPENSLPVATNGYRFTRTRGMWLPDESLTAGPVPVVGIRQLAGTFARDHTRWQLAFVIGRAIYRQLVTIEALQEYADARRRAPGNANLRAAIMLVRSRCAGTRCWTEDASLRDLLDAGAPVPIVNTRGIMGMSRDEPDFVWLETLRNIEMDGGQHGDPAQAEDDRRRDEEAARRGWAVLRVWTRDYWRHRRRVVAQMLRFIGGEHVTTIPGTRILDVRR